MHVTPPRPPGPGRAPGKRRRWGLLALVAVPIVLSGCTDSSVPNFGAYRSATKTGQSTFHLWQGFSIAAIIIGVFTLLLIAWAALRYRARRGDDSLPRQTQYHLPLEITYTVIPIVIVFALFAATVVVEDQVTATPPPATTIQVFAFQWGWQFTYPSSDFLVPTKGFSIIGQTTQEPTMVMPEGVDVRIVLRSLDVVHGFYIRQFNFSRYALPGVTNIFTFHAVTTGTYFGQCTQLCGLYHSLMFFRVRVVPESGPGGYEQWLAGELAARPVTNSVSASAAVLLQLNSGIPVKPSIGAGVK